MANLVSVQRCGVLGCERPVWARGLCDTHLSRLRRHGHLEPTRATDWGERRKHPLYGYWKQVRRNNSHVCEEWHRDFWSFAQSIGERPSLKHVLWRPDKTKPLGPGNAAWTTSKGGPALDQQHTDAREHHRIYMAEYQRKLRARDPFHSLRAGLWREYGITLEQYEAMFDAQNGVCAICGRADRRTATSNATLRRICVDHDHKTGAIRGVLCADCNQAMGLLDDQIELLQRAISYLRDPPAKPFGLTATGARRKRTPRVREPSPYVTEGA